MWKLLHPKMTMDHLGLIPMLVHSTGEPLKQQINRNYSHGGGWNPAGFSKMVFNPADCSAKYPGDPAMLPLASFDNQGEMLYFYDYAIVAVVDADGNAEFSRMD
jgi:hypothetical protein